MPYLIDGHNLIPKIPGLTLDEIDDEQRLIELLQDYCRRSQKQADVYFDNAPAGQLRVQKHGRVTAFFVRSGGTADQAISQRLARLGGAARNWTVVSSDAQVQGYARAVRARVLSAEAFAHMLRELVSNAHSTESKPDKEKLSPEEVDDWLALFGSGDPDKPTK